METAFWITTGLLLVNLVGIGVLVFRSLSRQATVEPDWSALLQVAVERLESLYRSETSSGRQDLALARQEILQALQAAGNQSADLLRGFDQKWTAQTLQGQENMTNRLESGKLAMEQKLEASARSWQAALAEAFQLQNSRQEGFERRLETLTKTTESRLEAMRATMEQKISALQADNSAKLELMRATVEEKLQTTLERRLGDSFKMVSENLQKVHTAMGEMQKLAEGVGDLKKVITNVRTRGTWGEIQLGSILEQFLSPQQYEANVATTGTAERVEFAIKLPGRGEGQQATVWLPIDAKFPKEDYERLVDALDRGAVAEAEEASKQLEIRIRGNAKDIREKYLSPPATTDFGLMFLPTEGLYAEVLRRPGLAEALQRDFRVVVAGPTTLVALLNSLQMGFRTLAIEKRSSEVWQTLGAVKTEFGRFGETLDRVQKKLRAATDDMDKVGIRTRAMERKLREVESMPDDLAREVLDDISVGGLLSKADESAE